MAKRATPAHFLALLRGINVGGNNLIKMADLRACFEALGFEDVLTYIQSGNVVFTTTATDQGRLTRNIERALSTTFDYESRVVLRSRDQLARVVDGAPSGFGARPETHRYDVLFLKEPLTPAEAVEQVPTREGVDEVFVGPGVLYFSRLIAKASQSRLSKVVGLPIYRSMTIRNWNTTTKLAALLAKR